MLPPWAQRIADLIAADSSKSVTGLARACGISQPSVSNWFGKGTPTKMISGDNLVSAAAYLGVTPEYIMLGRDRASLGESGAEVSSSNETRLDPEIISAVHEALRRMYKKELKRPFDIEKEPARFVQVYGFRKRLSPDLPIADFIEMLRMTRLDEPESSQGVDSDGRTRQGKDDLPVNGDDKGRVAGRVQRK